MVMPARRCGTQSNAVCAWKKRHLRFLALLYSISTNDEHVSFYY